MMKLRTLSLMAFAICAAQFSTTQGGCFIKPRDQQSINHRRAVDFRPKAKPAPKKTAPAPTAAQPQQSR